MRTVGLGGVAVWSLDLDDFHGICGKGPYPLVSALKSILHTHPLVAHKYDTHTQPRRTLKGYHKRGIDDYTAMPEIHRLDDVVEPRNYNNDRERIVHPGHHAVSTVNTETQVTESPTYVVPSIKQQTSTGQSRQSRLFRLRDILKGAYDKILKKNGEQTKKIKIKDILKNAYATQSRDSQKNVLYQDRIIHNTKSRMQEILHNGNYGHQRDTHTFNNQRTFKNMLNKEEALSDKNETVNTSSANIDGPAEQSDAHSNSSHIYGSVGKSMPHLLQALTGSVYNMANSISIVVTIPMRSLVDNVLDRMKNNSQGSTIGEHENASDPDEHRDHRRVKRSSKRMYQGKIM